MEKSDLQAVCQKVALLAEGVDRNEQLTDAIKGYGVALLAEGVDRNSEEATLTLMLK